mgnify:CR=1 FL=1
MAESTLTLDLTGLRDAVAGKFFGGATGAIALNQLLLEALPKLTTYAQIIHSTGKGKGIDFNNPNYHPNVPNS